MSSSRNLKIGRWSLVVGLVAIAAAVGILWGTSGSALLADKQVEAEAPAIGVMAIVGGLEVRQEEVESLVAGELRRLEQQRHQALEQGLDRLISQRLLELEASARGISEETLLDREVDAKVTEPTDADVDAFYEARKDQIRQPKEQLVDRIREFLQQQGAEARRKELLAELRAKHGVRSYLEPWRVPVEAGDSPSFGPADAPVTIVEFSDFECPFCSRIVPTLERVKEEYAGKIRLVFRQFPLHSLHPNAQKAAEASLCANEQEKFWEMHDLLFKEQKALAVEQLKQKAARLELDVERFNSCLDSDRFAAKVQEDLDAGSAVGVSGTPAIFINGRLLAGAQPFDAIAEVIDDELARSGG